MLITLIVFIVILGILIFVHEAGHFVAARLAKIKVEEFAFGFPPRLLSWKRGETRYALNLLPIGGYVKLLGEDGDSPDPRSFGKQPVLTRLTVVVAGVLMNFLLAIVVLWIGFGIGMVPIVSNPAELGGVQSSRVIITGIAPDSPAATSDLRAGDILEGYGTPLALQEYTRSHIGETVTLTIDRDGTLITKSVTLGTDATAPLGVGIYQLTKVKLGFFGALRAAVLETGRTMSTTFLFLGQFFTQLFTTGTVADGVSGPVGIYQVTGQAVNLGLTYVLQLLAVLSINLGLLNILPFPALDGGRGLFIALEGIIRRKVVREELEAAIHAIGFFLLLGLIALITYKDIIHLGQ